MFKKALALLSFIALLAFTFPSFAQDATASSAPDWSVSLYDQAAGKLTFVSPTGQPLGESTLPISEGFETYGYNVAVSSATGAYAYLISQVGDGTNPVRPSKLIVYNPAIQSITVSHDLDPAITSEGVNAAGTSLRFNSDGSRVLVGYYVPADAGAYTLEISALDTFTGEVISTLTSDNLTSVGVNPAAAYYTQVISFQGETAAFILRPVTPAPDVGPFALHWNTTTNEVTSAPAAWLYATDYRPQTAELLLLTYDPAVDTLSGGESAPAPDATLPPNTVQLMNILSGSPTTLYAADTSLTSAKFVQNGERILLFSGNGAHGILIDRSGTVLKEFDNLPGDTFTFGTPQGFFYADPQQSGPLVAVNTQDGDYTATPFYTAQSPYTSIVFQPNS